MWIWISPNTTVFSFFQTNCILFPAPALKSCQIRFLEIIFWCSFIFWVSKLVSKVPQMPFWNTDDKERWPLCSCVMPSGTGMWTDPQPVNISALVTELKAGLRRLRKDREREFICTAVNTLPFQLEWQNRCFLELTCWLWTAWNISCASCD